MGADGCTLSDAIARAAETALQRGDFVRRVARLTTAARKAGLLTGPQAGAVMSCAARADLR
jgi:hypothetical protein